MDCGLPITQRNVSIPYDLEAALAQNVQAQNAFSLLDKTAQYVIILPILKATTSERRAARLLKAITKLEKKIT